MTAKEMMDYMKTDNYKKHMLHVVKAVKVYKHDAADWEVAKPIATFLEVDRFSKKYDIPYKKIVEFCEDVSSCDWRSCYNKVADYYSKQKPTGIQQSK